MSGDKQIKVLVVRFSSIGDIVLCTPVLRCLKNNTGKSTEVHFVTKKAYLPILEHNPYVDHLHLLDGRLSTLITELRAMDFDYIIDLHHNIRSALVKIGLRKPSGSFLKLNLEKWLLTRFKIDRLPERHIVERYFEAAGITGIKNDGDGLDFFLPDNLTVNMDAFSHDPKQGFIAFVIGGKHATKRLPNEKIIAICRKLPAPVLLLGGHDDASNGQVIADACGGKTFNGCGKYSLKESAFLVKQARLVISHDTGLMHIAAAFNKHLISIWGNTVPA
ncbi:MAG: lipopolysaccharide heptosyltransferase family protein, partial [Bacteroidia bacterium]